jgi:sugar phosphate isomerase/epimerase
MQLGFVTAILADRSLEQVAKFAAETGFECLEVMCWPVGKAERRYAGVTHLDVDGFNKARAAEVRELLGGLGISLSGLGYYPNPLAPDAQERQTCVAHLKKVIRAAELLEVKTVNTFVGRDWTKSVDGNWPLFRKVWPPLIRFAEDHGVRIGIENCPMLFSADEWPGGKNLATSPALWRRMFEEIPSNSFGLNFDPSHLLWQQMDYCAPLVEFSDRLFHVHAKDARVKWDDLAEVGVLATPLQWHEPKLPGLGEVNWGDFFAALTSASYNGPVAIEVEDRAYEGSLRDRQRALLQSKRFLEQFVS